MNNSISVSGERLSDLMDGRLQDAGALADMLSDPQAVQTWHLYHLVGDVLRSDELAPSVRDLAFLQRLEHKLAAEPARPQVGMDVAADMPVRAATAANAQVFRWKWLAGVACAAVVGVVGSGVWNQTAVGTSPQLASTPAAVDATAQVAVLAPDNQTMIRDPQLDALMAAHQQLGGHSALQMPSGFLRNATYERPGR